MRNIINVGLAGIWAGFDPRDPKIVEHALKAATRILALDPQVSSATVKDSDSEPTLVIETNDDVLPESLFRLSEYLNQDAVAYYNPGHKFGLLVGPRAEKWGVFNPRYFLLSDGQRAG